MNDEAYKFAKLFELPEGHQVAVLLGNDDDGYPEVRFHSYIDGLFAQAAIGFGPKDDSREWDENKAWDLAEQCFNSVTDEQATNIRRDLKQMTE